MFFLSISSAFVVHVAAAITHSSSSTDIFVPSEAPGAVLTGPNTGNLNKHGSEFTSRSVNGDLLAPLRASLRSSKLAFTEAVCQFLESGDLEQRVKLLVKKQITTRSKSLGGPGSAGTSQYCSSTNTPGSSVSAESESPRCPGDAVTVTPGRNKLLPRSAFLAQRSEAQSREPSE